MSGWFWKAVRKSLLGEGDCKVSCEMCWEGADYRSYLASVFQVSQKKLKKQKLMARE